MYTSETRKKGKCGERREMKCKGRLILHGLHVAASRQAVSRQNLDMAGPK